MPPGTKQHDTKCYLVVLGGTLGFLLLIRVSQVRDLHGLPKTDFKEIINSLIEIKQPFLAPMQRENF